MQDSRNKDWKEVAEMDDESGTTACVFYFLYFYSFASLLAVSWVNTTKD